MNALGVQKIATAVTSAAMWRQLSGFPAGEINDLRELVKIFENHSAPDGGK